MSRALGLMALATIAACAGEPVHPPEVPTEERYTPSSIPEQTVQADVHGGAAQRFVTRGDIPSEWWALFQSPALDGLVRQALGASPTLAQARARLNGAQEELDAQSGSTRYPKVDANLSAYRVDVRPESVGARTLPIETPLNLYLATVSVSYTLDIFGSTRRERDAMHAEVDYQQYELEAVRLMLAGNVVTAAIREASLREQIESTEEIISLKAEQLAITEHLAALGTAAEDDVVSARLDVAQNRARLPELQRQLEQVRHRLAVYTGQAPGAAQLPEFRLAELQLPSELPVSVPSELARQRPDIRAAEALLHQAGARVGVATANLYPQITLSATGGRLNSSGSVLSGGAGFYLLGASLTQPIFHGMELRAKRRAAIAAYEKAGAAYKEVVLEGLRNVADVMRALESDARTLRERADAAAQASRHQDILAARYQAGGVSYYALLDGRQKLCSARVEQTQAVADRYTDSAALFQALGGGWWTRQDQAGAVSESR